MANQSSASVMGPLDQALMSESSPTKLRVSGSMAAQVQNQVSEMALINIQ